MRKRWIALAAMAAAGLAAGPPSDIAKDAKPTGELHRPVRVEAAGKPIDTAIGHAHPLYADFDGDGVPDLLVGQFGDGLLWLYKNTGTAAKPQFAAGVKFKGGEKGGRVPTG
jgi:hypothetical protein